MADVLKIRGDLLGLGKTSIEPVKVRKHPTSSILAVGTLALVLIGSAAGAVHQVMIDREKAEQLAAAQAEAAEREKNRERDAKLNQIHALAQRYQHELERDRKRVVGTIENVESYREKIPQVKKFLAEYQLPAEVDSAIRQPVDLTEATMSDTHDLQVKNIAEPTNLKAKYARWRELLAAAGRYAEGIDRNNAYFNNYLKEARIEEQFRREFGKKPMQQAPAAQPLSEAAPAKPAEPVVEPVVAEPAAPVVEAKPAALAPIPKPRAVEPKPKTVPAGNGRVQVTDW
ncbi:TPA: hypothetical protein ACRMZW_004313 [Pseudomonas aeruginosa]